jgi:ABC-type polysaccharide/polyol phosphate export permease
MGRHKGICPGEIGRRMVKDILKSKIKNVPKKAAIAIFYLIALILAGIVVMHHNPLGDPTTELMKKVTACILIVFTCIIFGIFYDRLTVLPKELLQNRRLIWKLAKNDFKKRYAGSYLGMVWAFVQPVVTVVMYWIVFDRVFDTRSQLVAGGIEVPYVLYLTAGLVPWFYFSEALSNGTTALMEYNYLVKKVVFKISILPIIKVIAATFIHVFFVVILLLIAIGYGYYPSVYTLQVFYYSFCEFVLVLAISYSTCAIVVFFRDLQQIIGIVLQIGMWATPILWDISMLSDTMKPLFKLNPMVYIVNGYRSAVYEQEWFFEHFYSSTYFWIFTVTLFCIGSLIFKRLKVHFADVM